MSKAISLDVSPYRTKYGSVFVGDEVVYLTTRTGQQSGHIGVYRGMRNNRCYVDTLAIRSSWFYKDTNKPVDWRQPYNVQKIYTKNDIYTRRTVLWKNRIFPTSITAKELAKEI